MVAASPYLVLAKAAVGSPSSEGCGCEFFSRKAPVPRPQSDSATGDVTAQPRILGRRFAALGATGPAPVGRDAKAAPAPEQHSFGHVELAATERNILQCLGAALIMHWSTLPRKLQSEIFERADSMSELLDTSALRGQIARFMHKHKDDDNGPARAVPVGRQ